MASASSAKTSTAPAPDDGPAFVATDEQREKWPAPETHQTKRLNAAKAEFAALKEWALGGKKGPMPAFPNFDVLQQKRANGGKEPRAKRARARKSGGTRTARSSATVRYYRDGEPVKESMQKLSTLAYFFTRGIASKDSLRLPTAEFRSLLASMGVTDPEHTTWTVTLPNGEVLSAVAPGGSAPAKQAPKKDAPKKQPAKKTAAKKSTPRKSAATKSTTKQAPTKQPAKKAAPGKRQVTPIPKKKS